MVQEYTPFPPPQQPRKVDLEMESGEYFLSASQKQTTAEKQKAERQKEALEAKKRKREDPYLPPKVNAWEACVQGLTLRTCSRCKTLLVASGLDDGIPLAAMGYLSLKLRLYRERTMCFEHNMIKPSVLYLQHWHGAWFKCLTVVDSCSDIRPLMGSIQKTLTIFGRIREEPISRRIKGCVFTDGLSNGEEALDICSCLNSHALGMQDLQKKKKKAKDADEKPADDSEQVAKLAESLKSKSKGKPRFNM